MKSFSRLSFSTVFLFFLLSLFSIGSAVQAQPQTFTHTFTAQGQIHSFPLSLGPRDVLRLTEFDTNPGGAEAAIWDTMKLYNSTGQLIQWGRTADIIGAPEAAGHPTSMEFTSPVPGTLQLTIVANKVAQEASFNAGTSDAAQAPLIRSRSFIWDGLFRGVTSFTPPNYSGRAYRNLKVSLKAGETLEAIGGIISINRGALNEGNANVVVSIKQLDGTGEVVLFGNNQPITLLPQGGINRSFGAATDGIYTLVLAIGDSGANPPLPPPSTRYRINLKTSLTPRAPQYGNRATYPLGSSSFHPTQGGASARCTGCGASDGDPVDLSTGQEDYAPGADLEVYNPKGADVVWARHYSGERALALKGSVGLPVGWSHNYDVRLESFTDGQKWPDIYLVYPNGGGDRIKPVIDGNGNLVLDASSNIQFTPPAGSPYIVTSPSMGSNSTKKTYGLTFITWKDGTEWQFTPFPDPEILRFSNYSGPGEPPPVPYDVQVADNSYQAPLTGIVAPTANATSPQTLNLSWSKDDRGNLYLNFVSAPDVGTLLSLTYSGTANSGYLLTQVTDFYNRKIVYTNAVLSGTAGANAVNVLQKVSMLGDAALSTTPPPRATFSYLNFEGKPMLSGITVPHPNNAATIGTALLNYNASGQVASLRDANLNVTRFTYGGGSALVESLNPSSVVELSYTAKFDGKGRNTGTIDAGGYGTTIVYGDAYNPDMPTSVTDAMSRTTTLTYDSNGFGNVRTITSPRGVKTTYGYNYGAWPLGRVVQAQDSLPDATTHPATTVTYVSGRERAGLIQTVTSPHPNAGAPGWPITATVQSTATYNDFGDPISISTPGHSGFASLTTTFNYTSDGAYTQPLLKGQVVRVVDAAGKISGFRYDGRGNPISARDAQNVTVSTLLYNLADQVIEDKMAATGQTGSGQGRTAYTYTYLGGPLKTTDLYDEGNTATPIRSVTATYGPEGEPLVQSGSTEPATVTYNSFYALKSFKDGKNFTKNFFYNTRGLLTQVQRTGFNTTTGVEILSLSSYAADGQLLSQTDGRSIVSNYAYTDPEGNLTTITYPAAPGENVSLQYDAWGRVQSRSDAAGSETYAYAESDAPLAVTTNYKRADGSFLPPLSLNARYFDDGLRQVLNGNGGSPTGGISFSNSYEARGLPTQLTDNINALSQTWSWRDNGTLSQQTTTVGWQSNPAYNALNQLTALTQTKTGALAQPALSFGHPTDVNQQLRYDGAGNMTREVATFGAGAGSGNGAGTTTYSYDTNDRLTGESSTRFGNYSRTHGYDAAYNRTTRSAALDGANTPWSETATVTNNNQLGTVTHTENSVTTRTSTHSYDGEGNRTLVSTTAGGVTTQTTYLYDREGRLSQVSNKVGAAAAVVAFKAGYRADGLRAWKENGLGVRTYFLYDGENVLAEFDDTGSIRALNTWGAAGLLSRRTYPTSGASTIKYYVWDVRGNIAAVTDSSGAILSTPKSEGYFSSGGDGNDPNATFGGQVGGYLDVETGLVLFQNRYYDRTNGIWLTRDPIGEAGGINLYAYVKGNPTNFVDPSGLVSPEPPLPKVTIVSEGGWAIKQYYPSEAAHGYHLHLENGRGVKISIDLAGKPINNVGLSVWNKLSKSEQKIAQKFMKKNACKMAEAVAQIEEWLAWKAAAQAERQAAALAAHVAAKRGGFIAGEAIGGLVGSGLKKITIWGWIAEIMIQTSENAY